MPPSSVGSNRPTSRIRSKNGAAVSLGDHEIDVAQLVLLAARVRGDEVDPLRSVGSKRLEECRDVRCGHCGPLLQHGAATFHRSALTLAGIADLLASRAR